MLTLSCGYNGFDGQAQVSRLIVREHLVSFLTVFYHVLSVTTIGHGTMDISDTTGRSMRWAEIVEDVEVSVSAAGIALEGLARVQESLLDRAIGPFKGLGIRNVEDFRFLALLRRSVPEGMTITETARLTGVTKASSSARIDRLLEAGIVQRNAVAHDRRTLSIVLDPSAYGLIEDAFRAMHAAHVQMFDGFSSKETAKFSEFLQRIHDNTVK